MSHISDTALALILAEGQLENAVKEERRWRLRKQEAQEKELEAKARVDLYIQRIAALRRGLCESYDKFGVGLYERLPTLSVRG